MHQVSFSHSRGDIRQLGQQRVNDILLFDACRSQIRHRHRILNGLLLLGCSRPLPSVGWLQRVLAVLLYSRLSAYAAGGWTGWMSAGLSEKALARVGRDVSELHMQACLAAGLSYGGSRSASHDQWAFRLGPCHGTDMADQLSISRFLLSRVAEYSEAGICYDLCSEAPACASAAGNRCTVHFSTANSRDPVSGLLAVQDMMDRLRHHHDSAQHLVSCVGSGSHKSAGSWHSVTGAFSDKNGQAGSASMAAPVAHHFTVGIGNKHAGIMVPTSTLINRYGPILDRRPPAGADPYLTTMLLVSAACGVPLPPSTVCAMQLAAVLQQIALNKSSGMTAPVVSSANPSFSCNSFGTGSFGRAMAGQSPAGC